MEGTIKNHQRTWYSVLVGLLMLLFGTFAVSNVDAAQVQANGTSAADAVITTAKGENVTGNNDLNKYVYFNATYKWSLPANTIVKAGDTATFELPSNVQIRVADTTFDVTDEEGHVVGSFTIKKGAHQGTLTFNDYFEKNNIKDIHGILNITVSGTEENKPSDWFLNKAGWLDAQNQANWTVVYNPKSLSLTNVEIKDTLQGEQVFDPSTVQVWFGTVDSNNQFVAEKKVTNPIEQGLVTVNGKVMEAKFDKLDQAVQFVYQSKPLKVEENLKLVNEVTGTSTELGSQSMTATIQLGGNGVADGSQTTEPEKPVVPDKPDCKPEQKPNNPCKPHRPHYPCRPGHKPCRPSHKPCRPCRPCKPQYPHCSNGNHKGHHTSHNNNGYHNGDKNHCHR